MKVMRKFTFLLLMILIFPLSILGCTKKPKNVTDIFNMRKSSLEFTKIKTVGKLPQNYKIVDNDGYLESENMYIVEKVRVVDATNHILESTKVLNIVSGENPERLILDEDLRPKSILVKHGYIAILGEDNLVSVYDRSGQIALSKAHFNEDEIKNSKRDLSDLIKVADKNTFVVSTAYLKEKKEKTASFFSPSTQGAVTERGRLVGEIYNPSDQIRNIAVVDNKYAIVREFDDKKIKSTSIWNIQFGKKIANYEKSPSNVEYEQHCSYLGLGQFYVEYSYQGTKDKHNLLLEENKYRQIVSLFFDANIEKEIANKTNYFYGTIYNKYTYNLDGVPVGRALKDGYHFCKFVIDASNKKAPTVDQIIINNKFQVVLSLTGNKGLKLDSIQNSEEGTFNDLMLDCVDDIIYVPTNPLILRVMNNKGKMIFENKDYKYLSAIANNGMIVCKAYEDDPKEFRHVVFKYDGTKVFDGFTDQQKITTKYGIKEIDFFRGNFALVSTKIGNKFALLSKQGILESEFRDTGNEILYDVAKTNKGSEIYEQNIYMYHKKENGLDLYGVKRLMQEEKKSIIQEAKFAKGTILYRVEQSPNKVIIFEYVGIGDDKIEFVMHEVK